MRRLPNLTTQIFIGLLLGIVVGYVWPTFGVAIRPLADAFLLFRRLAGFLLGLVGLGFLGIVLATDELDLRDLAAVAAAMPKAQNPRVSARPAGKVALGHELLVGLDDDAAGDAQVPGEDARRR